MLTVVRAVARLWLTSGDNAEKQEVPSGPPAAQAPQSLVAELCGNLASPLSQALHPLSCVGRLARVKEFQTLTPHWTLNYIKAQSGSASSGWILAGCPRNN